MQPGPGKEREEENNETKTLCPDGGNQQIPARGQFIERMR
jgi:hypothetical protein